MTLPANCPHCGSDFQPRGFSRLIRSALGGNSYSSSIIGLISQEFDELIAWQCPRCRHEWVCLSGDNGPQTERRSRRFLSSLQEVTGQAINDLAMAFEAQGKSDQALIHYRLLEVFALRTAHKFLLQVALCDQARLLHLKREFDAALILHERSEVVGRELGENGVALLRGTLVGQALILTDRQDPVRAAALLEEALVLGWMARDNPWEAMATKHLQELRKIVRNLDRAILLHRQHRWDWRKEGNPSEVCVGLMNKGVLIESQGDLDGAMTLYEKAEQICREWPSFPGLAISLGHQADIHVARKQRCRARACYDEQELLYRELGNQKGLEQNRAARERDLPPRPPDDQTAAWVIAEVEELGGTVQVDEKLPEKPVIAVNLSASEITDKQLEFLWRLERLEILDLAETSISDSGLLTISKLPHLQVLVLTHTSITDQGLVHLQRLPELKHLFLGAAAISDTGLSSLQSMTNLEALSLGGTPITDAGLGALKRLKNLKSLDLRDTNVTDQSVSAISELPSLNKLNLIRTRITVRGVEDLRQKIARPVEIMN